MEQQTSGQASNQPSGSKKSNAGLIVIIVVVVVLVGLGIAGKFVFDFLSKKAAEKVTESALERVTGGKVDVNSNTGTVTVRDDKGNTQVIGSKLPSNYPSDIPVYPGSTVTTSSVGTDSSSGAAVSSLSLTTPDSSEKVQTYLDTALADKGWAKGESGTFGAATSFVATKGDRQLAIEVLGNTTENLTSILIIESVK